MAIRFRRMDAGIEDAIQASTHDIGVGGAFIETDQPLPVGTALDLEIDLGVDGAAGADDEAGASSGGDIVALTGEVRWVAEPGRGPAGHPSGMGVKFGPLEVDVLLALSDYFAELARAEGRS